MSINAGTVYVDVKADTHSAESGVKSGFSKLAKIGAGAFAAAFAVKQVVDVALDFTHAAEEAAAANRKSLLIIRRDADAAAIKFKGLTKFSEDFGDSIGQDDEAITNLAARITSSFDLKKLFGNNAQKGLEGLTKGVVDFAAATGKSQNLAVRLFQSIANTPTAALGQLQKLGIITQQQSDHFKTMADNGHAAEVSQQLLTLAQDHFAGAAEKAATPSQKLSAVFDNLKETLGGFLLPYFSKFVGYLTEGVKWLQSLFSGSKKANGQLGGFASTLKTRFAPVADLVNTILDTGRSIFNDIFTLVKTKVAPTIQKLAEGPFGKLVIFLGKVFLLMQKLQFFILGKLVHALVVVLGPAISFIGDLLNGLAAAIVWVINGIIRGINTVIHGVNLVKPGSDIPSIPTIDLSGGGTPAPTGSTSSVGVPHGNVPGLASGGVVTKPTLALIGEAGPEAVVPLGGSGSGPGQMALTITNWEAGTGYFRFLARDEAAQDATFEATRGRMAR